MKYGYARVSTAQQAAKYGLDVQKDQLREAGAEKIYADAYTGTKASRPEWDKLLGELKADDGTFFSIAITGMAYFDSNTLHLTRIKGEVSYPNHPSRWGDAHMFKMSFQKITPVPLIKVRRLYQIDYDDTDGMPVVRQIKHTEIHYDKIVSKSTVQEIP